MEGRGGGGGMWGGRVQGLGSRCKNQIGRTHAASTHQLLFAVLGGQKAWGWAGGC